MANTYVNKITEFGLQIAVYSGMGRQLNDTEKLAFETILKEIEQKHKDFFEDRNDKVTNHISYMIEDYVCYMEWNPKSDLSQKIRHEISKAFHSIHNQL
mgnify:CR=1 FL=1